MKTLIRKHPKYVQASLILGALLLAWFNRFLQDDAFISFRYAQHLAAGHGLVYNIGERVEGYTNFLWTVCMAPAFILGVDVATWGHVVSLLAFAITLSASAKLACALWKSEMAGILTILFLAMNHSFLCYATGGGLETQFGIAWIMLAVWGVCSQRYRVAAIASACAFMTRMDAALLLFPFWCGPLWNAAAHRNERGRLVYAVLLGATPVVLWMIWRYCYYGAWVPNTFLVKGHGLNLLRGLYYVSLFYLVYALWLVFLLDWKSKWRSFTHHPAGLCMTVAVLMWTLYLIAVGGDFMEFRLMMPTFPFVAILIAGVMAENIQSEGHAQRVTGLGVLTAIVLVSQAHGWFKISYPSVLSIDQLNRMPLLYILTDEIHSAFGNDPSDVKIGTTCAGVLPFYTQLPTLDLLGLNDRDVALKGDWIVPRGRLGCLPGHTRMATWDMVREKGVNLLINHPWVVDPYSPVLTWDAQKILRHWYLGEWTNPEQTYMFWVRFPTSGVSAPPVIAWPLSNGYHWLTAYINPHPAVDAAILRTGARIIR